MVIKWRDSSVVNMLMSMGSGAVNMLMRTSVDVVNMLMRNIVNMIIIWSRFVCVSDENQWEEVSE